MIIKKLGGNTRWKVKIKFCIKFRILNVIINKFKENETVDVKGLLENAFKIYYDMQINKNKVS